MRGQGRLTCPRVKVQTMDTCDAIEGASVREKVSRKSVLCRENSGKPAGETQNRPEPTVREGQGSTLEAWAVSVPRLLSASKRGRRAKPGLLKAWLL